MIDNGATLVKNPVSAQKLSSMKRAGVFNLITDHSDQPNPRLVKMAIVSMAEIIEEDPFGNYIVFFTLNVERIHQMTGISIGTVVQTLWTKMKIRWSDDGKTQSAQFDRRVFE